MTLITFRQMVAAELLRLRRKRSILATAAFFSVGVLVIYFSVSAIEHASNPVAYGPAGGLHNFNSATVVMSVFFGALSAILIGTEAGTTDLASGVFRDLVVTGRSRLWLFCVRVPAALIVTLALALCGLGVSLFVAYVLAGGGPTPSATYAIDSVLWVCGAQAVVCVIALGLGSLTGSRAVSLTTLIGWTVIASRLLPTITFLGNARYAIPNIALGGLKPGQPLPDANGIIPGAAISLAILAAWVVVWLAVGAWRTNTQDA